MGLSTILMQELCTRMRHGVRVASMGYPDIIAPRKELEAILGAKIYNIKNREDSEAIGKWHGVTHAIPDAHSFFELQGASLDVYDVVAHRGGEIVVDLNYPVEAFGRQPYDFVLDIGTLEHCFNIGQAALNMASLLAKGGVILHENPFNWGNHGFYNMNPTWYVDFYGQPGFKLLDLKMIARNCDRDGKEIDDVPSCRRFRYMSTEANMVAIAERTDLRPVVYPVQGKYKKMIPAAGDRASSKGEQPWQSQAA